MKMAYVRTICWIPVSDFLIQIFLIDSDFFGALREDVISLTKKEQLKSMIKGIKTM